MQSEFSFKELYDVCIKANTPIKLGTREIEAGETVIYLDKVSIGNFDEISQHISANGGFENPPQVSWENTEGMKIILQQGIFSKEQFAILHDLKLIGSNRKNPVLVSQRDFLEIENGKVMLSHQPHNQPFCYNRKTGQKLPYTLNPNNFKELTFMEIPDYTEIIVDYYYIYEGKTTTAVIGRAALNGFLSLQARTKEKDDITGQVKTGIITIPKFKLMSDLSMVLGKTVDPHMGKMVLMAYPAGSRTNKTVMEIAFLDDDIDSDI